MNSLLSYTSKFDYLEEDVTKKMTTRMGMIKQFFT